ncbi:MAG: alpha/beta hydrolase [Oscillochloridaceae bacterium umkhey_bin13]
MQRNQRHLAALIVWLGGSEALASRAGFRGLSWGGGQLAGAGLALLAAQAGRPGPKTLLTSLPLALLVHLTVAQLRQRHLDPKRQLQPGSYPDRQIVRLGLPGQAGPIPALHIVPQGGSKAVVCVAHGSGCDKTFYAWRLVDQLVTQGFAVLLVDLDGHGESPRPQAFPTISTSLGDALHWLRSRYGYVAMLGVSLGGAVATHAIAKGAPCDALILWATPPQLRLNAQDYRRVQRTEAVRLVRWPLLHLFRDGSPYHIARAWQTSGIRANIGTWDLFDALDLLGSLRQLAAQPQRLPLLLVYAGRDAVLPPGSAATVQAATQAWADFHSIAGASHVSLPIEPATIHLTVAWLLRQLNAASFGAATASVPQP